MKYNSSNLFEYKGYFGSIKYSVSDKIFHGKVEGIRGLISYEGQSVDELEFSFKEAIDDYLIMCEEEEIIPQKSKVNLDEIEVPIRLYETLFSYSASKNISPSQTIIEALDSYITV